MKKEFTSELEIIIRTAMRKKGIYTYKELYKICDLHGINIRFSDILQGKQKIKEDDLLKLSEKLEIPMSYFQQKMKKEIKYYVDEYKPEFKYDYIKNDKENKKRYLHEYYLNVLKPKRKRMKEEKNGI